MVTKNKSRNQKSSKQIMESSKQIRLSLIKYVDFNDVNCNL